MLNLFQLSVLGLTATASMVSAALNKATVYPDGLSPHFVWGNLPQVSATQKGILVPAQCTAYKNMKNGDGSAYCPGNMIARQVNYADCQGNFVFCTCETGQGTQTQSMDDLVAQFSRLPPSFKQNVRYVLGMPAASRWAETFVGPNDILFFGKPSDNGMNVYLHEAAHAMDGGNSGSSNWKSTVDSSSCVPDPYANSNYVEDFAQVGVIKAWLAFHNNQFPDSTNTACLNSQLAYWQNNNRLNNAALTIKQCDANIKAGHNPPLTNVVTPDVVEVQNETDSIVCDYPQVVETTS